MKKIVVFLAVGFISFLTGGFVCLYFVSCQVEKLQMYVEPHGRGMFLVENNHLIGMTQKVDRSFDVIFTDTGFTFLFFYKDSRLDYECIDQNGDGIPERICLFRGCEQELRKSLNEIVIEKQ